MNDRSRATLLSCTAMIAGYCGAAQWHPASFAFALFSVVIIYRFRT